MKTLRFSEDEILQIEKECKIYNQKFSTYARKKILDIEMKSQIEMNLILELKRIGNNLNQIAKKINEDDKAEKLQLFTKLASIENEIKKLNSDS